MEVHPSTADPGYQHQLIAGADKRRHFHARRSAGAPMELTRRHCRAAGERCPAIPVCEQSCASWAGGVCPIRVWTKKSSTGVAWAGAIHQFTLQNIKIVANVSAKR